MELQRSLLGFDDIAAAEGLKPSEAEIEVGWAGLREMRCLFAALRLSAAVAVDAGTPRHAVLLSC